MVVEIWSDIVCPWCYIGKRRFESALSRFAKREQVDVIWRSFELDPDSERQPQGSLDRMLAEKYGVSLEEARRMNAHVTELAKAEGLDYRLYEARRGNTFDAHRLLHFAAIEGKQAELKERLMRAYFTEGEPIGDRETLAKLAAEVGLDADEAGSVLQSDEYAAEVRADEQRAWTLGITGVPFFVLDGRYGVSGAQPAELLLEALEKAWETRRSAVDSR